MTATKFELEIDKLADALETDAAAVVQWVGIKMQDDLTEMTPRDTGYASANWNLVSGDIPDATVKGERRQYPKGTTGIRKVSLNSIRDTGVVSLSNNVEYIVPLEDGHSKQAPNGFFAVTVARFRRYMRKAIREARRAR